MSKGIAKTTNLTTSGLVAHNTAPNWDFLYEASTVKNPNYNLGDRVVTPDGRVFRYGKCGYSLTDMKGACYNYQPLITEKDAIGVAADIGDKVIELTFDDSDGVSGDGVIAEDELRGGYISFYRDTVRQQRGIIGNTARANGDTGNTKVYLDAALTTAVNEDDYVEVLANPYGDLRGGAGGEQFGIWCSVMGMPNVKATTGQYFWIQTWGPFRVSPTGAELGVNQGERMFVFGSNGCVYSDRAYVDGGAPANHSYQNAGPILARTDGDAGSAAPFINLMINP
jgi:hypothetical protein